MVILIYFYRWWIGFQGGQKSHANLEHSLVQTCERKRKKINAFCKCCFFYLHEYTGKWGDSCCPQYRIPECLKEKPNSYSKVLSETPKETTWLLLSLTLKWHFADTSPSGVHTQHNLTYGLFPPRSKLKMSHFHNRASRARCRGKSKNFCQFMEIKTQNWGRRAWQALPARGSWKFSVSAHPLGSIWGVCFGKSLGTPSGDLEGISLGPLLSPCAISTRAEVWGDWRMFCCRYGN